MICSPVYDENDALKLVCNHFATKQECPAWYDTKLISESRLM